MLKLNLKLKLNCSLKVEIRIFFHFFSQALNRNTSLQICKFVLIL